MKIQLVDKPTRTQNLFASLESLKGKWLPVVERNGHGDCLCIVDGQYLIDVWARVTKAAK